MLSRSVMHLCLPHCPLPPRTHVVGCAHQAITQAHCSSHDDIRMLLASNNGLGPTRASKHTGSTIIIHKLAFYTCNCRWGQASPKHKGGLLRRLWIPVMDKSCVSMQFFIHSVVCWHDGPQTQVVRAHEQSILAQKSAALCQPCDLSHIISWRVD